jgi:parallel beta-helix repeat protein
MRSILLHSQHWYSNLRNAVLVTGSTLVIGALSSLGQNPLFVHTQPANAIRTAEATLNGMVLSGSNPATVWFEWGTNQFYGNVGPVTDVPASSQVVAFRLLINDLSPDQVFHCRLVASNLAGVVYGADQKFILGGSVSVWGNPAFGHTVVPADLTNAVAIAGGGDHCLALRNDATVAAWGGNAYGQRDVPTDLGEVIAISAGQYHSLALLADGTVRAWGAGTILSSNFPEGGQSIVPVGLADVVQIAAGTTHSLALKSDGTVAAWGSARINCCFWNDMGQGVVPLGLSNVVAISGGDFHSTALLADGTVVVWGDATYGQADIPPGLTNVVSLNAGWYHNLAMKADGALSAWGLGTVSTGFPYFGQAIVPPGLSNVVELAGGGFYSLALRTNGTVIGWGRDDYGQVIGAAGPDNVVHIAAGYDFGLALRRTAFGGPPTPGTRYVNANSANPTPPYTSWETAALTIQQAIDVALAGDDILVTNGVYETGGMIVPGAGGANRVAVTKALAVQSVNGPDFTVIRGYRVPVDIYGKASTRCAYLTNGASLSGFTMTNGATVYDHTPFALGGNGGGVWCESATSVLTNCVLAGNSASESGGGAFGGTLHNCTLVGNSALGSGGGVFNGTLRDCTLMNNCAPLYDGGGSFGGTLYTCILTNNSSYFGGGASQGVLYNCTLSGNTVLSSGGGAYLCLLTNCTLTDNRSSLDGGGVVASTLRNCFLSGNSAVGNGGGALESDLINCVLTGNSAGGNGGGAYGYGLENCILTGNSAGQGGGAAGYEGGIPCLLNNCTVVGNTATTNAGGVFDVELNNCIVYSNTAPNPANYAGASVFNSSCTVPMPTKGVGNITNAPLFVDLGSGNLHLQSNSPCINGGSNVSTSGAPDPDGNPRIVGGTVDIGAYEFQSPASKLSYAWAQKYGLPTDGSADYLDADTDLMNNWQEWMAGTIPTDASSAMRLLQPTKAAFGITVSWQSVTNRTYFLERATDLGIGSPFSLLTSNLFGQSGTTSFTDTNAIVPGPFFYRVGVQ